MKKNLVSKIQKYFIALYKRQLSTVSKMKYYNPNSNFVSPEGPHTRANKTSFNLINYFFYDL